MSIRSFFSISSILGWLLLIYICHSMWHLAQLFKDLQCTQKPCYTYLLNENPKLQLAIFTSPSYKPTNAEVKNVYRLADFNYREPLTVNLELVLPRSTRRNGTLHMHIVLAYVGQSLNWETLRRDGPTVIYTMPISAFLNKPTNQYTLLANEKLSAPEEDALPITHLRKDAFITLLTGKMSLSANDVPVEMARLMHITTTHHILPILHADFFETRLEHFMPITRETSKFNITIHYIPISTGRLRLMILVEQAVELAAQLGFTQRDLDDIKGMFSSTSLNLLLCTIFISGVHLLFDFLSFKNDIAFWRNKNTYAGVSLRTRIWQAVSQGILFLFLLDQGSSMLVLLPAGIGVLIELWKSKRLLKLQRQPTTKGSAEQWTEVFDEQGMRYLSYIMYPLCLLYAVYSLIYTQQRSWYAWLLQSLANGVYAFGFLFMLPQLFINYKLKSVAALPWRVFMYKAFNTFIDDFFAFLITMPTMHRMACFRDDIVFLIYLYQRWLYPVDKSRIDNEHAIHDCANDLTDQQTIETVKLNKKNK